MCLLLLLAGLAHARPDGLFAHIFPGGEVSTTPRYEPHYPTVVYKIFPSAKPSISGGGGFWGLPPPPDSPYMGSVSTPSGILYPPTWRDDVPCSTTRPRHGPALEERASTQGPQTSTLASETKGRLAKKWCARYRRNCKSTKREANEISIRITGGQPAPPKEHPHMAMIGYGPKSRRQWLCGGSLISERFVLSAAHCVNTTKMGPARWVRLGDLDISTSREDEGPQDREISERIVHPDYREPQVYNDIVLFRLDREVEFTPWVRPVCLQAEPELASRSATITGWGRTDFVSQTSPALMEVEVRLFGEERCRELVDPSAGPKMPRGYDPRTMICAGHELGGKDACQGDSGGPLVVEGEGCAKTQIGITSVGKECGLPDSPGVYTRVHHFLPWIESVVWPTG